MKKQRQRKFRPIDVEQYKDGYSDLSNKGKMRLLLIWALQASDESDIEIKGLKELLQARQVLQKNENDAEWIFEGLFDDKLSTKLNI